MPRREDLKRILVIGAGPIVIGQACEFDYSGTQACKALRSEGLEVILVNSNPATIMTDPEMSDRTYIEPLTVEAVTKVIEKEKPDAILPTVGGQTALNLAVSLHEAGVLAAARHGTHVLCEKPLSIDAPSARRMVAAAAGPTLPSLMPPIEPGQYSLKDVSRHAAREAERAGLVVVGSTKAGPVRRATVGSTAGPPVGDTPCPAAAPPRGFFGRGASPPPTRRAGLPAAPPSPAARHDAP